MPYYFFIRASSSFLLSSYEFMKALEAKIFSYFGIEALLNEKPDWNVEIGGDGCIIGREGSLLLWASLI